MNKTKEIFITGFALFAMFFGAGNLILPPFLGFHYGENWGWVTLGFIITAVAIPLLGLFAHAKLQGTMLDFGNKFSPKFSLIYCFSIYLVAITLPAPRTAAVTYEMAILPFFETSALLTSFIYFALVLFFVWNRSQIIDWIGKFITPLIVVILFLIISIAFFAPESSLTTTGMPIPFVEGLLEGYQTFDAIGAVLIGGVIIISLNNKVSLSYAERKLFIAKVSLVAALGLMLIYAGLILTGALLHDSFDDTVSRTQLLSGLGFVTLGSLGNALLSVLISLACFTTAVGIVTGTADFIKGLLKDSNKAYKATAIIACATGVLIGQLDVNYILLVAKPVLFLIYPITIAMILLHVMPNSWVSAPVFRTVVVTAMLFSIPDVMGALKLTFLQPFQEILPLGKYNMGWLLPAIVVFILGNVLETKKQTV
jgi:LIVCS family branched-chain amino acid:cation transporter